MDANALDRRISSHTSERSVADVIPIRVAAEGQPNRSEFADVVEGPMQC